MPIFIPMHALYLENGALRLVPDYPKPTPQMNEALIRVLVAGICATDLELVKGYAGGFCGVLGHEFVGIVEQASEQNWVGKRVVSSINVGCGQCQICRQQGAAHCERRSVPGIHHRDGVFAEYVTLPLANLHVVPDGVADEAAVFTEPLAAALRIREQVRVQPTGRTAVIGPGRLGLLVGQVLALDGTNVTMIGRRAASLLLPQQLGLATMLVADAPTKGFDLVVEATGNAAGLAQALQWVRPLGTVILKSTFGGMATVDLTPIVVNEITVVGSRCGPFGPALRLLAQEQVQVAPLIDGRYPLVEAEAAMAQAAQPGVRKVLLHISHNL